MRDRLLDAGMVDDEAIVVDHDYVDADAHLELGTHLRDQLEHRHVKADHAEQHLLPDDLLRLLQHLGVLRRLRLARVELVLDHVLHVVLLQAPEHLVARERVHRLVREVLEVRRVQRVHGPQVLEPIVKFIKVEMLSLLFKAACN